MDLTKEDKRQAAASKLIERGFFVEYPTRPITLDTIPIDGSEFIHRSRLEDAKLSYCVDPNVNSVTGSKTALNCMKRWGREEGKEFSDLSHGLIANKQGLIKVFRKKLLTPRNGDEKKWCIFCLGSKMFSQIYGEDLSKETQGHPPILSIVIHFSQEQIKMLISYFYLWVLEVGINDDMGRWIYALFALLEKPIDKIFLKELEAFHDHCKTIVKSSDNESYKYRVYLIVALLKHCFCVKAYTVGPDVDRYIQTFKL